MTQVLESEAEDIKTVIITLFLMFENLSRDMEDIRKTQIELLKLKSTMSKMKKKVCWIVFKTNLMF